MYLYRLYCVKAFIFILWNIFDTSTGTYFSHVCSFSFPYMPYVVSIDFGQYKVEVEVLSFHIITLYFSPKKLWSKPAPIWGSKRIHPCTECHQAREGICQAVPRLTRWAQGWSELSRQTPNQTVYAALWCLWWRGSWHLSVAMY